MRILIVGATGFIGANFLDTIPGGDHQILAIGHERRIHGGRSREVKWLYGDLRALEAIKPSVVSFNPDVVLYLAWHGIPDYSNRVSKENLDCSIALLDFVLEETDCKKILVSGSCWEYGKSMGECIESDPVVINSYFAWAKYSLYQYLHFKCQQKGVALIWFRMFYVYGPGQRADSLIPTIVKAFNSDMVPQIKNVFNKNDYVYVEDVANALWLAIQNDVQPGIYNLGSGNATSVLNVCQLVEETLTGRTEVSGRLRSDCKESEESNFWANTDRTKSILKWNSTVSLHEGITKYVESLNRRKVILN